MPELLATEQKSVVAKWIAEGASLSEVQKRINFEFGISITYMELRFLVDDLNVTPVDKVVPPPPTPAAPSRPAPSKGTGGVEDMLIDDTPQDPPGPPYTGDPEGDNGSSGTANAEAGDSGTTGSVNISFDAVQRPGVVASGSVTFSDGKTGQWFLDGYGQIGFEPPHKGYQPTPQDVHQFQSMLEKELTKGGY